MPLPTSGGSPSLSYIEVFDSLGVYFYTLGHPFPALLDEEAACLSYTVLARVRYQACSQACI